MRVEKVRRPTVTGEWTVIRSRLQKGYLNPSLRQASSNNRATRPAANDNNVCGQFHPSMVAIQYGLAGMKLGSRVNRTLVFSL
jgi:hypothetical protein